MTPKPPPSDNRSHHTRFAVDIACIECVGSVDDLGQIERQILAALRRQPELAGRLTPSDSILVTWPSIKNSDGAEYHLEQLRVGR